MSLFPKDLIRQETALVYIDDFFLMTNSKSDILQLIKQLHDVANKGNLEGAPEKTLSMTLTVKKLIMKLASKQINQFNPKTLQITKWPDELQV